MDQVVEFFVTAGDFTEVRASSGKNFERKPVYDWHVCHGLG